MELNICEVTGGGAMTQDTHFTGMMLQIRPFLFIFLPLLELVR